MGWKKQTYKLNSILTINAGFLTAKIKLPTAAVTNGIIEEKVSVQ